MGFANAKAAKAFFAKQREKGIPAAPQSVSIPHMKNYASNSIGSVGQTAASKRITSPQFNAANPQMKTQPI